MKILMVNTIEFNRNGMSAMIMNYYQKFNHDEVKVDFLVNKRMDDGFKEIIRENGDNIFIFKNRNKHPLSYMKYLKLIAQKNNYDIVYVHGNSATMAAEEFSLRNVDTKIIVHAHGETTDHPLLNRVLHPYFKKHYTAAFAASEAAGNFLFNNKSFKVIRNGIDGKSFAFNEASRKLLRKKLNLEDSNVVLQVGAFTKQKNHIFTIAMIKKLVENKPNTKLLLAGDGPLKKEIEILVSNLKLNNNVIFLGEVSNLLELYSASDYLIFPSSWEPFGIVALEGQMSGLPVFVSNVFSKSVAVTENITYIPLIVNEWVDVISNSKLRGHLPTQNLLLSLQNTGYDIQDNANYLIRLFREIIKEKNEG
ncbi:glycosyltransferase [Leuconostoc gelidum]|uniref:glycosyltransferase n=1 Tax=Leuconostoc gelidum TaxID=1244 RepID=UPI001CC5672A|nr:glycosyltransferase [Leuconostoc gelidum]MBZ6001564.1 glycosyltransferase [Leuconostoc gelidum subsp. gelidum]